MINQASEFAREYVCGRVNECASVGVVEVSGEPGRERVNERVRARVWVGTYVTERMSVWVLEPGCECDRVRE